MLSRTVNLANSVWKIFLSINRFENLFTRPPFHILHASDRQWKYSTSKVRNSWTVHEFAWKKWTRLKRYFQYILLILLKRLLWNYQVTYKQSNRNLQKTKTIIAQHSTTQYEQVAKLAHLFVIRNRLSRRCACMYVHNMSVNACVDLAVACHCCCCCCSSDADADADTRHLRMDRCARHCCKAIYTANAKINPDWNYEWSAQKHRKT